MKKVLSICLMMLLVFNLSIGVLAAPNGFVKSPSGTPAPEVITFAPVDGDCTAELIVTPYNDKETLPQEYLDLFNKAYDSITSADDLTKLNEEFAKLVKEMGLDGDDLAVGELFNLHVEGCTNHEDHVDFEIVLKPENLNNFVGLLQMNENGVWELVSNAKVVSNGQHLSFALSYFSPLAIVLDTSAQGTPTTGDSSNVIIYVIIMAISALALIVIAILRKKNKA